MMLAAVCCFVLASCNNKPVEPPVADQPEATAECSQSENPECAAWKDWANQTPEQKAELVKNAIEKINAKKAECEAKKAECEAKKAELEAKWLEVEKLDVEAQKALIDEMMAFYKPCCKKKEGCCKKKEACDKTEEQPK